MKVTRMKIAAIIQARMGSTRLPGKILKDISGKTMLERTLERVNRSETIDEIIVATTVEKRDDVIGQLMQNSGIAVFRGSEEDVLDRYYKAAQAYNVDVIVRICSDCPLIEPRIIDKVVRAFLDAVPPVDYAANYLEKTYPRGLEVEVVNIDILERIWHETKEPYQRAHVLQYILDNPEQFKLLSIKGDKDYSWMRWTVDTAKDLQFVREIYSRLGDSGEFTWLDVIALLEKEPSIIEINKDVKQKAVKEG